MALADILAAIKSCLEEIPDVGKVWTYEPHTVRMEDFNAYFKPDYVDDIRAWTMTRESTMERDATLNGQNFALHTIILRHYRSVGDHAESEAEFQDGIETVRTKLRRQQMNTFFLEEVTICGPPSVRIVGHQMMQSGSGPLVHYAELIFPVEEMIWIAEEVA